MNEADSFAREIRLDLITEARVNDTKFTLQVIKVFSFFA